jgi:Domain of Unknown Function (DUF1206)
MSAPAIAREQANRAARSTTVDRVGRAGFAALGTTYLLIGWIAGQLALGSRPSGKADQRGAFQALARQPYGRVLLVVLVVGLLGYVVYLAVTAVWGEPDEPKPGPQRLAVRAGTAARALGYLVVSYAALTVIIQKRSSAGSGSGAGLIGKPYGRWLIGLIGIGLVAGGLALAVTGMMRRFEKHLKTGQMTMSTRKVVSALGVVGTVARGLAFALTGAFFVHAAWIFDPQEAQGLDASLRDLLRHTGGRTALAAIAVGLLVFGLFCWCEARWRRTGRESQAQ